MGQGHLGDPDLASEDSVLLVPLGADVLPAVAVAPLEVAAAGLDHVLARTPDFAPDGRKMSPF